MEIHQKSHLSNRMRLFLLCFLLLTSVTGFSQKKKSGAFQYNYRIDPEFMHSKFKPEFLDSLDWEEISFFDPESPYFTIHSKVELTDNQLREILWCMLLGKEEYGIFGSDDCYDKKLIRLIIPI